MSQELVVGAAVAMGGAIAALAVALGVLWRRQTSSQRACERERGDLNIFIREELMRIAGGYSAHTEAVVPVLRRLQRLLNSRQQPGSPDVDETPLTPQRTHG